MGYLDQVKTTLETLKTINLSGRFHPCTMEEVRNLEQKVRLKLPLAYKEFLLWSGHGLGNFEIGSDFYYDELVEMQEIAPEILKANPVVNRPEFPQKLPDDAFVFWMHQGYQFTFFRTSEGDNPPVHYYNDPTAKDFLWNYQAHFTDFLITELKNHARWAENSRRLQDEIARDWQNA